MLKSGKKAKYNPILRKRSRDMTSLAYHQDKDDDKLYSSEKKKLKKGDMDKGKGGDSQDT